MLPCSICESKDIKITYSNVAFAFAGRRTPIFPSGLSNGQRSSVVIFFPSQRGDI